MFTLEGKLIQILEDSKIGNSTLRSILVETFEEKPKQIKMDLWNEKASLVSNKDINKTISVGFEIESKPYNGRYFTNIKAYSINVIGSSTTVTDTKAAAEDFDMILPDDDIDDLPF